MYHIFFIHSSVDGHLGCFHVLAIVNSAAVNIRVHASFQIMVFSGYIGNDFYAREIWPSKPLAVPHYHKNKVPIPQNNPCKTHFQKNEILIPKITPNSQTCTSRKQAENPLQPSGRAHSPVPTSDWVVDNKRQKRIPLGKARGHRSEMTRDSFQWEELEATRWS